MTFFQKILEKTRALQRVLKDFLKGCAPYPPPPKKKKSKKKNNVNNTRVLIIHVKVAFL